MSLTYFARMVRDMDHPAATKSDYTRIPKGLGRGPDGSPIHYLLNAKADDPSKVTKAELRQMLKNVAFHRLKLQYHMETTIVDGWAVRIAPGGLKIKEVSQDAPGKSIQVFFSGMAPRNGQLISYGPVIDMTGLTGKVFEITWNPKIIPSPSAGARGGTVGGANVPFPDYNPPLEKQLEEQLGLTITKEKVPVQVLVVDHLEEPSEN
jgi:uncharacterized protein (TIGR03435 family)